MSTIKKRSWKTVELEETDMADFAAMGGLEIDVLSDDSEILRSLASKKKGGVPEVAKPKKKKTKSKKPVVTAEAQVEVEETPTNAAVVEIEPVEALDMSAWSEFAFTVHPRILAGLTALKFVKPSPIQAAVLDKAMDGFDILGAAQTGSGKTLAFGLPILQSVLTSKSDPAYEPATRALCILPTRELAIQVKDHLEAITGSDVSVGCVVGGMSVDKQFRVLLKKPDVVVGTPGRIAGLLGISKSKEASQISPEFKRDLCSRLSFFVLDEADRLLEDSHFRDLTEIMRFVYQSIPSVETVQSFIFSATLPVEGIELGKLMKRLRLKPVAKRLVIDLVGYGEPSARAAGDKPSLPTGLKFKTMFAPTEDDREPFLMYYLLNKFVKRDDSTTGTPSGKIIVFVNAISYVYRLSSLLPECLPGVKVVGIHSNLRQKDRLKKLDQFKGCKATVMVATDLAARGLDLPAVDAIVHLQPPRTPESLIHRSGRTARAGRDGECAMIITPKQAAQWNKSIKQGLGRDAESIDTINVVSVDIRNVRAIHRLASKLEGASHKERRESKEKAWSKKTCEEADLWDSDLSEGEFAGFEDDDSADEVLVDGKESRPVRKSANPERQELEELLLNPLPSLRS